MEQLQRGILLVLTCLVVISPGMIRYRQHQYYIETWSKVKAELFIEGICREGCCIWEEYLEFSDRIGEAFGETHIFLEEYRRTFGPNGTEYRTLISWEEIKEALAANGKYEFQLGAEVRLYVGKQGYYGLIRGEDERT